MKMCKIPPYKLRRGFVGKKRETMMADPDDGNEQIADGITQRSGPQRNQRRERRLCWWSQVQNHNCDNHREDGIRECHKPLCWSRSLSHDCASVATITHHVSAYEDTACFASMMMSTTLCGALSSGV